MPSLGGLKKDFKTNYIMSETLQIEKDKLISAYRNADDQGKELLVTLHGRDIFLPKPTERVASVEDACAILEEDYAVHFPPKLSQYLTSDEIAYRKLKLIVRALNKLAGFVADWSNSNQGKYYPWFYVVKQKKASSGFGLSFFVFDYGCTYTAVGSRLCVGSAEHARYIGTHFIDLYDSFFIN